MKVLITGGSGYLGQFLLQALGSQHDVAYTYRSRRLQSCDFQAFQADIATGEGLWAALESFRPEVVINCAALSQPAACEKDFEACSALNRPSTLISALKQLQNQYNTATLLIHLSTDQVYNGSRAWWAETDSADPVNAYGRSKLEAEQMLQQQWEGKFVALRSSLIFGPEPPFAGVDRPLFLQFVRDVLQKQQDTTFFVDEFRCAVYVEDICSIASTIISKLQGIQQRQQPTDTVSAGCTIAGLPHSVYNMGGPERLSRHDIAVAVAQHCGLSTKAVLPAYSADVKRGYNSPLDISMKMDQLLQDMPEVKLTPLATALQQIFPSVQT